MSSSRTCEIQELIAHVKDLQCTMPKDFSKACLDSFRQELLDVVSTTDKIRKEQGILKGLHFDSMKVRHSRVVEAHAKTFDWIFATHRLPSTDPRSRITFERWLRFGQGIYWISGKAGSGKSTLMKYLEDSRVAEKALLEWAGNAPYSGKLLFLDSRNRNAKVVRKSSSIFTLRYFERMSRSDSRDLPGSLELKSL